MTLTVEERRKKRAYRMALSGIQRGGKARFLTLTSSPESPRDVHHSFRILKERLRRRGQFEYLAVRERTKSGLTHLHVLCRGRFIPQGWLSDAWKSIHKAPVVWITLVNSGGEASRYVCKYVGKELADRFWWSWRWVYRGASLVWRVAIRS